MGTGKYDRYKVMAKLVGTAIALYSRYIVFLMGEKLARKRLEAIEVKGSEDPKAEANLMMALDIIADWFAEAIIEEAKAEVERDVRAKKNK